MKTEVDYKSIGDYLKELSTKAANNETVTADGGAMVALEMQSAIIDQLKFKGVIFDKANKIILGTGNGAKVSYGIDPLTIEPSAGARAYWVNESAQSAASKGQFAAAEITLGKLVVRVPVTEELNYDSVSLAQYVIDTAVRQIIYKVEYEMIHGINKTIKGVTGDGDSGSIAVTIAATPTEANMLTMFGKLHPMSYNDAVWYMAPDIFVKIQNTNWTNDNVFNFEGGKTYIYGIPVEVCPQLTLGPYQIILGNFSLYTLVMRKMKISESANVRFLFDEHEYRIELRVGGDATCSRGTLQDSNVYGHFIVSDGTIAEMSSSSSSDSSESSESSESSVSSESSSSDSSASSQSSSSSSSSESSVSSESSEDSSSSSSSQSSVSSQG